MSRSDYVWVVTTEAGSVVTAKTVKRELIAWLDSHSKEQLQQLRLVRVTDHLNHVVQLDPMTLLVLDGLSHWEEDEEEPAGDCSNCGKVGVHAHTCTGPAGNRRKES